MMAEEAVKDKPIRIGYFPYLFMGGEDEIDLEFARVWNLGRRCRQEIPDPKLREYIERVLSEYRDYKRPIRDMTLVSMKGRTCIDMTDHDIAALNEVRTLLFICYASKSNIHQGENSGHLTVTSENFTLMHQNIQVDKERTAYVGGRIVRVISGGRKIGEHPIDTPPYVLKASGKMFDHHLRKALLRLRRKSRKYYNKILTATAAMMDGYYNAPDHPDETSILAQCRAFEVLLDLPVHQERKVFKERIAVFCAEKNARRFRYSYVASRSKKAGTAAQVEIWADRFYTLRNAIIHGDSLSRTCSLYHRQRHTDLALWFFLVCLKKMVNEAFGKDLFHDVIRSVTGGFEYDAKPFDRDVEEFVRVYEKREAARARRAERARRRREQARKRAAPEDSPGGDEVSHESP